MGPGLKLGVDWSVAVSHARLEREGQEDLTGSTDHYWTNVPIVPRRLELRLSPVSWADIGGEIGWLDGGVDARFGIPAEPGAFVAGNIALGARSGQAGPFKDTKRTYGAWARTEFYPLLDETRTGKLRKSHRGVLALGLDVGAFYHQIYEPPGRDDPNEGLGFSAKQLIRDEARIEAAVGYVLLNERASVLAAVEPYLAFDLGTDSASCSLCSRYTQSWGVVLVFNAAFFLSFERDP
jgi:hypothetical protein